MNAESVNRARLALQRDAALARVGRARGWAFASAAGLSGAFAALVWGLAPGHSLSSASAATRSGAATTTPATPAPVVTAKMPPAAGPGALGLQGPSSAPGGGSQSQAAQQQAAAQAAAQQQAAAQASQPAGPVAVSGGS